MLTFQRRAVPVSQTTDQKSRVSNPTIFHGEVLCQLGLESYILAWHNRVLPKYIDLFMYGSSDFILAKLSF